MAACSTLSFAFTRLSCACNGQVSGQVLSFNSATLQSNTSGKTETRLRNEIRPSFERKPSKAGGVPTAETLCNTGSTHTPIPVHSTPLRASITLDYTALATQIADTITGRHRSAHAGHRSNGGSHGIPSPRLYHAHLSQRSIERRLATGKWQVASGKAGSQQQGCGLRSSKPQRSIKNKAGMLAQLTCLEAAELTLASHQPSNKARSALADNMLECHYVHGVYSSRCRSGTAAPHSDAMRLILRVHMPMRQRPHTHARNAPRRQLCWFTKRCRGLPCFVAPFRAGHSDIGPPFREITVHIARSHRSSACSRVSFMGCAILGLEDEAY